MHMIDYASVDENKKPGVAGFKLAYAAGCRGVQIRGMYDLGAKPFADSFWKRDADDARTAGLQVGPYLIVNWLDGVEPEARVDAFADAVGELKRGIDLVPAFDIEFPHAIVGTKHTRPELMAIIRRYVAAMTKRFGVPPELYFSGRVWNTDDADTLGNPSAPDLVDCSPWVAYYPYQYKQPPVFSPPDTIGLGRSGAPTPWGWAFKHQYQGDARGYPGIGQVDLTRVIPINPFAKGPSVDWVQRRLMAYFRTQAVVVDMTVTPGVYDAPMQQRVKLFQKLNGLLADGIIGLKTHTMLNWVPLDGSKPKLMRPGTDPGIGPAAPLPRAVAIGPQSSRGGSSTSVKLGRLGRALLGRSVG